MTTEEFIIELFGRVDDELQTVPKHTQARLWPSEVVTLGLLFALKGVGNRAFYRWLDRDWRPLFPRAPSDPALPAVPDPLGLDGPLPGRSHPLGGD